MYLRGKPALAARLLVSLASIAVLGLAAYWSLRLAYADHLFHRDSPEEITRALEILPGNARYHARSAVLDPASTASALREAVTLNPHYSQGWIELGLLAEMNGDFRSAEDSLLKAARVDKTYEPRWTLTNYFFRRDDREKFWFWAREAALMAYQDQTALFELCWRATRDAQLILSRAIPDRPLIIRQYLHFLLRSERLDAAEPVAHRLLLRREGNDLSLLLGYCDRLLGAGEVPAAIRLWNSLSEFGFIPHRRLVPEQGSFLTNGDFAVAPLSHGFDWRIASLTGVSVVRTGSPAGLRITFSGSQPERCRIMEQFVPLAPSRTYRLRFGYRTSGISAGAGLRLRIAEATSGKELSSSPADLSHEDWTQKDLVFAAPPEVRLARLMLTYQRTRGTRRIEGSLFLRGLALDLLAIP